MRVEGVDLSDVDFPFGWNLLVPAAQPTPQQMIDERELSMLWK
jgi:hypothetical protein